MLKLDLVDILQTKKFIFKQHHLEGSLNDILYTRWHYFKS